MLNLDILSKIDYTLLEDCNLEDILLLCKKAKELKVKSVCVYPKWVGVCKDFLIDSDVLVCTVIDFPLGQNDIDIKIKESKNAIESGADELDIVINRSKIEQSDVLENELRSWADFCHQYQNKLGENIVLKVIVESGLLTLLETEKVTEICIHSGVDFIKTSTGKVGIGAEIEKVLCMKQTILKLNSTLKIKASGGIRTMNDIESFSNYVNRFGIGYKTVDSLVENS